MIRLADKEENSCTSGPWSGPDHSDLYTKSDTAKTTSPQNLWGYKKRAPPTRDPKAKANQTITNANWNWHGKGVQDEHYNTRDSWGDVGRNPQKYYWYSHKENDWDRSAGVTWGDASHSGLQENGEIVEKEKDLTNGTRRRKRRTLSGIPMIRNALNGTSSR